MGSEILMSHDDSVGERNGDGGNSRPLVIATAFEVTLMFAAILMYIWRWHHIHPASWIPLFALILISHALHRDTVRGLGLGRAGLGASARLVLPLAILVYLALLCFGFARHYLALLHPTWQSLLVLLGYGSWCAFQQYLTQSYFNNRLMVVIRNRHLSSTLTGVLFSAAHIPNIVLMVATLVAGVIFAEVFAHHRNIWPLALAQAVGGLLLAAVVPDALIHHMRVGTGVFLL